MVKTDYHDLYSIPINISFYELHIIYIFCLIEKAKNKTLSTS